MRRATAPLRALAGPGWRAAATLRALGAAVAATPCAFLALWGSAEAYPDVGAVDFGESYGKVAEADPDVSRLNVSWRGIDNTVRQNDSPLRACDDRGVYNWCNMDARLRRYAYTGTPVHLVLVGVPPWAERDGCDVRAEFRPGRRVNACSPAPEHLDEWRAFVTNAVHRYGPGGYFWDRLGAEDDVLDVRGWEVWNEPNLPSFWNGHRAEPGEARAWFTERAVSQYAQLLRVTDAAIEAVNATNGDAPDAWTVGPSAFVQGDPLWEKEFASRPEADRLDRVSFHPYDDSVEAALADVATMDELFPGRPVWITEHGWGAGPVSEPFNAGGAAAQRAHFDRFLDAVRADHPHVARYVYYNGVDRRTDPPPPAHSPYDEMGLYTDDERPKPILEAFHAQAGPDWSVVARAADAAGRLAAAVEPRSR